MSVWMACVWGLLGASAIEAHQLHSAIGRVKNLPWRVKGELPLKPYLVALALRLALGVGMAAAFGASGQAGGPVGVLAVGIAAPKVLEQLAGGKLAELEMLRSSQSRLPAPQSDLDDVSNGPHGAAATALSPQPGPASAPTATPVPSFRPDPGRAEGAAGDG
ncbi:hypothetical protein [Streptomyces adustus]